MCLIRKIKCTGLERREFALGNEGQLPEAKRFWAEPEIYLGRWKGRGQRAAEHSRWRKQHEQNQGDAREESRWGGRDVQGLREGPRLEGDQAPNSRLARCSALWVRAEVTKPQKREFTGSPAKGAKAFEKGKKMDRHADRRQTGSWKDSGPYLDHMGCGARTAGVIKQ